MSFVEALANVALGYGVALAAQMVIFPAFGLVVTLGEHLAIGAAFTVVSIARSYLVRRLFNRLRFAQGGVVRGPGTNRLMGE